MPYASREVQTAAHRRYYEANRERIKQRAREYYQTHKEQVRVTNARYRAAHKPALNAREQRRYYTKRDSILFTKYGLREVDVVALLAAQGGGCAICGGNHLLGVDHDHVTGNVRGVLCRRCNSGIGQLGDDPARVERALIYLRNDKKLRQFFIADRGDERDAV